MNLRKEMIIIDDKFCDDIDSCTYNFHNNTFKIKYKYNNKYYNFSKKRVKYITKSNFIKINNCIVYANNLVLRNIRELYEFSVNNLKYYRAFFADNTYINYTEDCLKIINKDRLKIIDYLKKISNIISLKSNDGKMLLSEQMKKIEINSLDTAFANYLKMSNDLTKPNKNEILIFPFGCNSSQYTAVKNAIYNKISVIEGPPGTGKTQTILNIVANLIIRDMTCQVTSNNNTAIENIESKLKEYNLNFFTALLGKKENKDIFIEKQDNKIPDLSDVKDMSFDNLTNEIKINNAIVREIYNTKKELAFITQKKYDLELEYKYFINLIKSRKLKLLNLKKYNKSKLDILSSEIMFLDDLNFLRKMKYIFIYRIGNFKFYRNNLELINKTLNNLTYLNHLDELENEINQKKEFLENNEFKEKEFIEASMNYFKKYLFLKYKEAKRKYTLDDLWLNYTNFSKDYPVVLSTTYSSRNTFDNSFKFDYIIMDEASQIDLATGTLALSSAKYAVIIGDEMQLPNIIPNNISKKCHKLFSEFNLEKCYDYSLNSFLSSVKTAVADIKITILVEHYRCHPKIIDFCNKKFYDNKLAIMTEDKNEEDVIKIIRTAKGNLARDKSSQRQVDEIKKILKKNINDVGIITPYRNQVELIKENFKNVEVDTIHKFQGREKNTIIISTVEDDISDFVGNAKILNVAISRAKKHLYFIVTGNKITNTNIQDFIDYVEYNNMEIENSKIFSSFDILYKQNELEKIKFFKKHNKILKYDSENIIYYLIKDIIKDYNGLEFHFHQSLNDLIIDKSLLNYEERKYASHYNTHIDFYIFKKIGDKPVLAIEVDGYNFHKKGTKQYERDQIKNTILDKYNIPWLRLTTNGSEEEVKIRNKLDKIIKK